MESTELQQGRKLLSSDADLRDRFLRDPSSVGRELGLSAAETRDLMQLSAPQAGASGHSQHGRRFLQACKVLPLTRRALQEHFTEFFNEYAAARASHAASTRPLGDDLAFARYVERKLRASAPQRPHWVLDLLRYERSRLQAADPARRIVVCLFRHDISRLVRSVARREETTQAFARMTVAVWWRPQRRGVVRYAVIPMPHLSRRSTKQEIVQ
ncbi:MAG: hypothetical protein WCD76_13400 [Pyrinomonadaceae bacterium]